MDEVLDVAVAREEAVRVEGRHVVLRVRRAHFLGAEQVVDQPPNGREVLRRDFLGLLVERLDQLRDVLVTPELSVDDVLLVAFEALQEPGPEEPAVVLADGVDHGDLAEVEVLLEELELVLEQRFVGREADPFVRVEVVDEVADGVFQHVVLEPLVVLQLLEEDREVVVELLPVPVRGADLLDEVRLLLLHREAVLEEPLLLLLVPRAQQQPAFLLLGLLELSLADLGLLELPVVALLHPQQLVSLGLDVLQDLP